MNDASNVSESEIRAEVRAWLEENWDPDLGLVEWRNLLIDAGWAMSAWPVEWLGKGLPAHIAAAPRICPEWVSATISTKAGLAPG